MRDQLFHTTGQMLSAGRGGSRDPSTVGEGLMRAIGWGLLLTVVAVVAILLAMWVRRQMIGGPSRRQEGVAGFTLGDLRRMRDEGKITPEEYEASRQRLVASAQKTIAEDAAARSEDVPPPEQPRTKDVDLVKDVES